MSRFKWKSAWDERAVTLFVCSRCRDGRKCPTYFSVLSIWIQNLCSSASHVFSYLQPRQQESLELFNKLHSSPLCHRQNRKSGFCPREMASKTHLVLSVLSNPIPTPSHVPMWGFAAPQNRLGNSTNDLPGKSQRAAITRSFADAPLLHGAHVWFLSGRPSFSLLFASALTSLLSLAHFAVCVTYFLSFLYSLPLSLTLFQPPVLPLFLSWACLFLHHTSASPFTSKYALVGCESCSNGRMIVFFTQKAIISQVYPSPHLHLHCKSVWSCINKHKKHRDLKIYIDFYILAYVWPSLTPGWMWRRLLLCSSPCPVSSGLHKQNVCPQFPSDAPLISSWEQKKFCRTCVAPVSREKQQVSPNAAGDK